MNYKKTLIASIAALAAVSFIAGCGDQKAAAPAKSASSDKAVTIKVGVSPVPGTQEPLQGRAEVEDFIATWGYPVVLKAADGGGGRG